MTLTTLRNLRLPRRSHTVDNSCTLPIVLRGIVPRKPEYGRCSFPFRGHNTKHRSYLVSRPVAQRNFRDFQQRCVGIVAGAGIAQATFSGRSL